MFIYYSKTRTISKIISLALCAVMFTLSVPNSVYAEQSTIERIKDIDECIEALDMFLPFVDNWATCDCMSPPVLKKRPEKVLTLGPNCTELFAALGLGDLVIGRSLVNHSRGPLPEYADIVKDCTAGGVS